MNAIARNTLPREHTRAWRQFWSDSAHVAGDTVRLELGDTWAALRCRRTGALVEQFVIETTPSEIVGRLAQLRLERAQQQ